MTIHHEIHGEGPRTVVLLHGWMMSGRVWSRCLEHLRLDGLRVVVAHQRGTEKSPAESFTLEEYATDAVALLDAIGADRATLVGHSMGGQIAQLVATKVPDRIEAMALLCPVPAMGLPLPEEAMQLFKGSATDRALGGTILDMACLQLEADAKAALLEDSATVSSACIEGSLDAWTGGGFADALGSVRARTLVVATDDPFLKPDFLTESVVQPIAGARLAVLPGPGHYVQVERPRETAALLEAFLA